MKKILVFAIILVFCFLLCCCSAKGEEEIPYLPLFDEEGNYLEENFIYNAALEKSGAHLIVDGKTEYCILHEGTTDESVLTAINDLKGYFNVLCGGIEVKVDSGETVGKAIKIGKYIPLPEKALEKAGAYIIDVAESDIYIYAETVYGITNGIYGFMEDYLGCMFFDRDTTYIPQLTTMILEKGTNEQIPAFNKRDVGDNELNNSAVFRHRLRVRKDESYDTNGCHRSLNRISKEILAAHPEYYAMVKRPQEGEEEERQTEAPTQLCFSNEEVIDLLEQAIVEEERKNAGKQTTWWDISQQDNMNYCVCENCSALIEKMDNPAAPIYNCVNIIAKRHPEIKISTLAYHYGSTPPVNIEFEPNVMIKWCIMSSNGANDYSAPIDEMRTKIAAQQYNEIIGWTALTENVFVWDYITDFFFYQLPFPCWYAMEGNIRLLRDCGVDGVFTLNAHNTRGFCDRLKANLAAHLLWDPDLDVKQFISKYLTLYVGKESAPYIREMYAFMQEKVKSPLWVYDFPTSHKKDYLSEENVNTYLSLLEQAFEKAEGNETYLKRLCYEKISVLYASVKLSYGTSEERKERREEMVRLCDEFSIVVLNELGSETIDKYR